MKSLFVSIAVMICGLWFGCAEDQVSSLESSMSIANVSALELPACKDLSPQEIADIAALRATMKIERDYDYAVDTINGYEWSTDLDLVKEMAVAEAAKIVVKEGACVVDDPSARIEFWCRMSNEWDGDMRLMCVLVIVDDNVTIDWEMNSRRRTGANECGWSTRTRVCRRQRLPNGESAPSECEHTADHDHCPDGRIYRN